jgi:Ca-activated chloride channel family protein
MAVLFAALCLTGLATAATNLELILDASGSMAAKIGGRSKMEIAKQALNELLFTLPKETNIAVRAYGHRRKGDCRDIELIAKFGEARAAMSSKVNVLQPLGQTPLAASIEEAAKDFAGHEGDENTVVLITDGAETCKGKPCEAAKVAHQAGL